MQACLCSLFLSFHPGMSRKYLTLSPQEDQVLFDILLSLHDSGDIQNGTLKGCGYNQVHKRLKQILPDTKHDSESIKTKFRAYKTKFNAQVEIMNASGLGWDDERGCCTCDKEVLVEWVKVCSHSNVSCVTVIIFVLALC